MNLWCDVGLNGIQDVQNDLRQFGLLQQYNKKKEKKKQYYDINFIFDKGIGKHHDY